MHIDVIIKPIHWALFIESICTLVLNNFINLYAINQAMRIRVIILKISAASPYV